MNSPRVKAAIESAKNELLKLTPEEFNREIEKHADSDIACMLRSAWLIDKEKEPNDSI